MTEAMSGFSADEDRTLNVRLYKLAMWVLEQAEKSDEDYAEMLQRMDPFEAARIQREECPFTGPACRALSSLIVHHLIGATPWTPTILSSFC